MKCCDGPLRGTRQLHYLTSGIPAVGTKPALRLAHCFKVRLSLDQRLLSHRSVETGMDGEMAHSEDREPPSASTRSLGKLQLSLLCTLDFGQGGLYEG